jgi:ABC transporter substrate binding protein
VIPIVFAGAGDPVGSGLVASLARPGGNVTGLSQQSVELAGKKNGSAGRLSAELKASERRESSSHNRRCRRESNDHPRLQGSVHYGSFDWR